MSQAQATFRGLFLSVFRASASRLRTSKAANTSISNSRAFLAKSIAAPRLARRGLPGTDEGAVRAACGVFPHRQPVPPRGCSRQSGANLLDRRLKRIHSGLGTGWECRTAHGASRQLGPRRIARRRLRCLLGQASSCGRIGHADLPVFPLLSRTLS